MSIFSTILASLVALEALYIMQLEMFASKEKLENVFGLSKEYLSMEEARVSMKNQGLYNGFIGVGLLFSRFFFPVNSQFIGTTPSRPRWRWRERFTQYLTLSSAKL